MLPPELFESEAFQKLSHAARTFYILLAVHKETDIQRSCLYEALKEYNSLLDLGLSEKDIEEEAKPGKRTKYSNGYFVIPQKHLEAYGYKAPYASKLKKELIEAGFIKIKYGGKGRYNAWNENITIYQFSGQWKSK